MQARSEEGASVDGDSETESEIPYSELVAAAKAGDLARVVAAYSRANADALSDVDEFGRSPLALAVQYGHTPVVRFLLEEGADANVPSAAGEGSLAPLHWAAANGDVAVAKLLLEGKTDASGGGGRGGRRGAGAHVDARDGMGQTPLHKAASLDERALIALLLAHGADVNAGDSDGWRPLHCAAEEGLTDAVTQLLIAGADPSLGCEGWETTPLHLAAGNARTGRSSSRDGPSSARPRISVRVAHGDVRLRNVVLDARTQAFVLIDFGNARTFPVQDGTQGAHSHSRFAADALDALRLYDDIIEPPKPYLSQTPPSASGRRQRERLQLVVSGGARMSDGRVG